MSRRSSCRRTGWPMPNFMLGSSRSRPSHIVSHLPPAPAAGEKSAAAAATGLTNAGSPRLEVASDMVKATEMWSRLWRPFVVVLPVAAVVLAVLYIVYRVVDTLPPRHLAIAAGVPG